jgi:hypothetical protein
LLFFADPAAGPINARRLSKSRLFKLPRQGQSSWQYGVACYRIELLNGSMNKIKIAIICAVALAALAVDFLQFQNIKALRQENEELKEKAAKVEPLQEQVERAAKDAASVTNDASIKDAQVRDLARLRGEVARLRQQTNELAKARQQIQDLNQRLAVESDASTRAVAVTQAAQAQAQKAQNDNACINNLRLIDGAKQQWALEFKKQTTDTPTMDDLKAYFQRGPNGDLPTCPDGGAYTIGTVGEKPTCTNPAHVLP